MHVGKRRINLEAIHRTYQTALESAPQTDPKALQQYLLSLEHTKLTKYNHIESLGIKPSKKAIKTSLTQIIPADMPLNEFAKRAQLSPNQLLQEISDETAQLQFVNALTASNFITATDYEPHQQVLSQTRQYTDISFATLTVSDSEPGLKSLYQAQPEHFLTPAKYQYSYIEITPETIKLPPISQESIDSFFQANPTSYQDTQIEYQITEFQPGRATQLAPDFPPEVQAVIDNYAQQHKRISHQTTSFETLLSHSSTQHRPYLPIAIEQGVSSFEEDNRLYVIKVLKSSPTQQVASDKQSKLQQDAEFEHYTHQLSRLVKDIADYAYMHPTSLVEVANNYHLTILSHTTSSPHPALITSLQDDETILKNFVTDPIQISPAHYQIIQVNRYTPPHPSSFEEALPELKSLYRREALEPEVSRQLASCTSLEALQAVCQQYGLNIKQNKSTIHDIDGNGAAVFDLRPTLNNPKPATLTQQSDGTHWVQLNDISFPGTEEDIITDLINRIDAEHYLSNITDS
jgi:hypothetical protein